jgi:ribosomal protein S18 acetylase RimI-like enzyme
MTLTKEITHYLEMTDPRQLCPSQVATTDVEMKQAKIACPELNRFFYTAVGGDWYWVDRLPWTYDQWLQYLNRPGHETWVLYCSGSPAGYFELQGEPGADVEIASLGLLPQFAGQGLGGHLLTEAIRRAWQKGATRVWLHTSSFDHPGALANYRARGFRLVKEETSYKELPDRPRDGKTAPKGANAMKIVRLLILTAQEVQERIAELGEDVPRGLTADQLANLYAEHLERLPPDVDVIGMYIGDNHLNIVANDDEVWALPDQTNPT